MYSLKVLNLPEYMSFPPAFLFILKGEPFKPSTTTGINPFQFNTNHRYNTTPQSFTQPTIAKNDNSKLVAMH